jgi:hypothetical protein
MLSEALRLTTLSHQSSAELAHMHVAQAPTRNGPVVPDVPWGRSFVIEGSDEQQDAMRSHSPVEDSSCRLPEEMLSRSLAGQSTMRPGSVVWQVTEKSQKSGLLAPPQATPRTSEEVSSDGIENMLASQLAFASNTISSLEEQCRVRAQEAIGLWQQLSQERGEHLEEHLRQRRECEELIRHVTLLKSELVSKQLMLDDLDNKLQSQRKETDELQSRLDGSVGKEDVQAYRDEILRLNGIIERIPDAEKDVESTLQSLRQECEAQNASIAIFQSRLKHQVGFFVLSHACVSDGVFFLYCSDARHFAAGRCDFREGQTN